MLQAVVSARYACVSRLRDGEKERSEGKETENGASRKFDNLSRAGVMTMAEVGGLRSAAGSPVSFIDSTATDQQEDSPRDLPKSHKCAGHVSFLTPSLV